MQIPRIPMREFVLIVATLGLCSALPLQCYRGLRESDYQALADYRADSADCLEKTADHPAAWMAEFRPQLRRLVSWERWQSQRLSRLAAYEDPAEERLAEEVFPAQERQRFWNRFNSVGALNGYRPPAMERRNRHEPHEAIVDRCRPILIAIGLLTLALLGLRLWRRCRPVR